MHPTKSHTSPAVGGGYVPYFYESGLYLSRPLLQRGASPYRYSGRTETYDFSSMAPTWREPSGPQTVEQVIADGYFAVPYGKAETAILTDKAHTSRQALEDVISQVRQRYGVFESNLYDLHRGVCEAHNAVHRIEARQAHPATDRQLYSANKVVNEIYAEIRKERARLWQDISRLKQTLPEAAQAYLGAYRKTSILYDGGEGS